MHLKISADFLPNKAFVSMIKMSNPVLLTMVQTQGHNKSIIDYKYWKSWWKQRTVIHDEIQLEARIIEKFCYGIHYRGRRELEIMWEHIMCLHYLMLLIPWFQHVTIWYPLSTLQRAICNLGQNSELTNWSHTIDNILISLIFEE